MFKQIQQKIAMDTKNKQFEEQDHPLKNTDHAFVQVGKNGEPVIPTENDRTKKPSEAEQKGIEGEHS